MPNGIGAKEVYSQMGVLTADPLRLILTLYDGVIEALVSYKALHERGDHRGKTRSLQKAMAILAELHAALDMEAGDVARNLGRLYAYMMGQLLNADFRRDTSGVERVMGMLRKLREGWDGIKAKGRTTGGYPAGVESRLSSGMRA
ncbi:MAG: flagellar export chaperone FliS [Thermodesulfobacteriota bacterium]